VKSVVKVFINVLTYFLSGLSIRNNKRILFGAWNGKIYGDNSKYLFEYLLMEEDLELIWIGNDHIREKLPVRDNVKFAKINSFKAYYYALTSKYVFFTNGYSDLTRIYCLRGAIITQLWHGGGIKKILADSLETKRDKGTLSASRWYDYKIGRYTFNKCQFFITSSEEREKNILSAFRYFGINDNCIIKHGQPRNDMLVNYSENEVSKLKDKFKKNFNIPYEKKIILYLPTFRDKKQEMNFSFLNLIKSDKKLKDILIKNNAIIIEKRHLNVASSSNTNEHSNLFYDLSSHANNIDTQELLLISDILITDYSGVYLDYLLLDRPIIHFAYDYEYYKNEDRGFKYDIRDVAGGVFVEKTENLVNELNLHLYNPNRLKDVRDSMNIIMNSYENGESCEHIVEIVLGMKVNK
jgi:CDP-glycerol glycerophosphotransferase (TagB/SpsB family)